jgi:hypothetical protein
MEVSTTPLRWRSLMNVQRSDEERCQRARRTNVTRLDYLNSGPVTVTSYNNPEDLRIGLQEHNHQNHFRLYVVEDLSRDVIEAFGDILDMEPDFFREHIVDYAWNNVRDRWWNPPNLNVVTKRQRWFQLRFVTARYFKTAASFLHGLEEASQFNVLRRPDDDLNNNSLWDDKGAVIGITRARASFWLGSTDDGEKKTKVGMCCSLEEKLYCSVIVATWFWC